MQVEHAKNRHLRDLAQAAEDFAFDIENRLRGHRTVQHEVNSLKIAFRSRWSQIGPELLDDLVGDGGGRLRTVISGGDDFPAELIGDLQHAAERRGIALAGQHLMATTDGEALQRGDSVEKGVCFVKKTGEEDARHGGQFNAR